MKKSTPSSKSKLGYQDGINIYKKRKKIMTTSQFTQNTGNSWGENSKKYLDLDHLQQNFEAEMDHQLLLPIPNEKYTTKTPHDVWTAGFTLIRGNWLFFIVDSCTKKIIYKQCQSKVRVNPFNSQDVIQGIYYTMNEYQVPRIIHTGSGKQFTSGPLGQFFRQTGRASSSVKCFPR